MFILVLVALLCGSFYLAFITKCEVNTNIIFTCEDNILFYSTSGLTSSEVVHTSEGNVVVCQTL